MGAHGSGIYTLDHVLERCKIDPITDCWVWAQAYNRSREAHHRTPTAWFPPQARVMSVPRIVAALQGLRLDRGWRAYNTCGTEGCCNPEHIRTGNSKLWGAYMAKSGRMSTVAAQASRAKTGAARAKISDEDVLAIMTSNEASPALAKRYGVTKATICKIRQGKRRLRMAPGSSVWAMR